MALSSEELCACIAALLVLRSSSTTAAATESGAESCTITYALYAAAESGGFTVATTASDEALPRSNWAATAVLSSEGCAAPALHAKGQRGG